MFKKTNNLQDKPEIGLCIVTHSLKQIATTATELQEENQPGVKLWGKNASIVQSPITFKRPQKMSKNLSRVRTRDLHTYL